MSEWKETNLGNFVKSISETYKFLPNEEVVFLNTSDILLGKVLNRKLESSKGLPGQAKKKIKKGDFLFSEIRPANGRYALIDFDADKYVVSTKLMVLRCNEKLDVNYFRFYLTSREILDYLQMIAEDRSGTFPQITFDHISSLYIKLPPLPEQTAIASVLSSLDDKIDLLHRQNATLEKMAETLFRQWFVEEAKEEWEEGTLSDLVESANTGLDAIRRSPIVENYTGIKCLRIQDISQSKPISNWGNTEVSDSDYKKAQLKKGDIIMARTCSPGILIHIQEDLPAVFNNGLARIRANKKNCHPLFLKYLFKTDLFINHIYGISDGTAVQLNMKLGDLLSYNISVPPRDILESYIEIVQKWDEKILINQTQIRTLTALRDTLLPKLMSGEVRVSEL